MPEGEERMYEFSHMFRPLSASFSVVFEEEQKFLSVGMKELPLSCLANSEM